MNELDSNSFSGAGIISGSLVVLAKALAVHRDNRGAKRDSRCRGSASAVIGATAVAASAHGSRASRAVCATGQANRGWLASRSSRSRLGDHLSTNARQPVHHAADVDVERAAPVVEIGVQEPRDHRDAGVVDQQVDPPDAVVDRGGEAVHLGSVGDVDDLGHHLDMASAGRLGGFFEAGFVDVTQRQVGTTARA